MNDDCRDHFKFEPIILNDDWVRSFNGERVAPKKESIEDDTFFVCKGEECSARCLLGKCETREAGGCYHDCRKEDARKQQGDCQNE